MQGRVVSASDLSQAHRFADFCPVFKIDDNTVVKTGDCVRFAEAAAMELVRERTSIPIPEIFNVYKDEDSGHVRIVMEYVPGDVLDKAWETFDDDQKAEVVQQLRDYFSQLRNIKGSFIGSVDGTACEDQMFTDELGAYGPYKDEAGFNDGIARALQNSQQGSWVDIASDIVVNALKGHDIVMTHGDFSPRNIIVQGTKVVALLDWELSGFYPEYWEYVKALYRPAWESDWIKERVVEKILHPYFSELAVLLQTREIVW